MPISNVLLTENWERVLCAMDSVHLRSLFRHPDAAEIEGLDIGSSGATPRSNLHTGFFSLKACFPVSPATRARKQQCCCTQSNVHRTF